MCFRHCAGKEASREGIHMLETIFNPDNLFFRMLAKGVDFVGLSLLWALCSLPVVTIGPATAALYYTVVKTFRHKNDGAFGMYLRNFWKNLKKGIPVTLVCIPIALFFAWGYDVMSHHIDTSMGVVMYMAYYVALVIPVGTVCYMFPLMGRFEFRMKDLPRTAFLMELRHLPSTVVIVMLTVELTVFTIENWWPVLFTPVLAALLTSLFLERIFPKYVGEEEAKLLAEEEEELEDENP